MLLSISERIITTKFFDSIIILWFGKLEVAKEEFYAAKKTINIWDVNVGNIVISKLVKTQNNSKYLIGYLDDVIRPLVLILHKMSGYVMTFKDKGGDKNKNINWCPYAQMMISYWKNIKPIGLRLEIGEKYWIQCFTSL